jgi:hypothetical protein
LVSGYRAIVHLSVFFPARAAMLRIPRMPVVLFTEHRENIPQSLVIYRVLGLSRFSFCQLLASISFEINSELTRIKSDALPSSSLRRIKILVRSEFFGRHVSCLADWFPPFRLKVIQN